MAFQIEAQTAPAVSIPVGKISCSLFAIDTTCNLVSPADTLVEPPIPGHELMNFPTVSFLITHPSGRQVLFDLGCRRDFWNLPEPIASIIDAKVPGIKVDKDLADILVEGGVDLGHLEAAIISHHHYDHFGNPDSFPKSMKLVVGPGFSAQFMPGYPTSRESPAFEEAFKNRQVEEVAFLDLVLAGYRAFDYFDDGSLYILDTPGHAIGHLSALVRTTEDTFVFLGGDICHFGGAFRPSSYIPMPASLEHDSINSMGRLQAPFACSLFTTCHPSPNDARTIPYYQPCSRPDSWYVDPPSALQSVKRLIELDANERILVLIAHDPGIMNVLPLFPNKTINNWFEAGWKEKLHWSFLAELPIEGKHREFLVDGTYKDGVRVKKLDGSLIP